MQQFISPNELENRSRNLYLLKEHSQFLILDISIRNIFADSSTFDKLIIYLSKLHPEYSMQVSEEKKNILHIEMEERRISYV